MAQGVRRLAGTAMAAIRYTEPPAAPTRLQVEADVALAVCASIVLPFPFGILNPAIVLLTGPLAVRRRYPLTAFWLTVAGYAITSSGNANAPHAAPRLLLWVFAAYCAAVYSRYRGRALLSLIVVSVLTAVGAPNKVPAVPAHITLLIMVVAAAGIGNAVRDWRRQLRRSAERLRQTRAEHEEATRRALELERQRIASELHDVVTHNVSVMVVQAGAARQVLASSPDEARQALLAVEASGRAAMSELRYLLGLLAPIGDGPAGNPAACGSADDGTAGNGTAENGTAEGAPAGDVSAGTGSAGTGTAAADAADGDGHVGGYGAAPGHPAAALAPQPGLSRLPALVERVLATGTPVTTRVTGAERALPPGLDLAAYRVVQEGLTNLLKHGAGAPAEVTIGYGDAALVIEVADSGPTAAAVPPGRGLSGLRERLSVYDGTLEAGPRPGGGWLVRATIPVMPRGGEEGNPGEAPRPVWRDYEVMQA